MGCTESVPVASEFDLPHQTGNSIAAGKYDDVCKSDKKIQLIIREKVFSWSGDTFKIKQRGGHSFGDLGIKGKSFAFRDQMVLENTVTKEPIAVCLKKFTVVSKEFKIYTTTPNFSGQTPSEREYNGLRLYTYADVVRVPFSSTQHIYLERANNKPTESQPPRIAEYVIQRVGGLWPKKRVVKHRGRSAALMQGGTWDGIRNSYLLTICPGIDPCLIICLCAICDEFDEVDNGYVDVDNDF